MQNKSRTVKTFRTRPMLLAVSAVLAGCASQLPPEPPTEAKLLFETCVKPNYPRDAMRNELVGTVIMRMHIAADGRLTESMITKSSGHPSLDQEAHFKLRTCRFQPATVNGKPVAEWTTIQYVWSLEGVDDPSETR